MTLQRISINQMNSSQLMSFLNNVLLDEFWKNLRSEEELKNFLASEWFEDWSLEERFPDEYLFCKDDYVESEEVYEEFNSSFIEKVLPLIGNCKIYTDLQRIVFWEENYYAEDYDVPPIHHPKISRISIKEYLLKVQKLRDELNNVLASF